ncbi:hypothetical protein ACQKWADRAFT_314900 [Trichoderma austrokoningii]
MNEDYTRWEAKANRLAADITTGDMDSLFNVYKDMKVMGIDFLGLLEKGLKDGKTEHLYTDGGVIESIQLGIKELYEVTEEIEEAAKWNNDLFFALINPYGDTENV